MDQRLQDPAGAVPPDWRGLCEELVRELECWRPLTEVPDCLARARAALAPPEPEVVGPSLEEVEELCEEHCFNVEGYESTECLQGLINDAIARYGHQPAPPAEGEAAEVAAWLRAYSDEEFGPHSEDPDTRWFARAAELLERQAAPVPALPEDAQVIKPAKHTILVPVPVPVAVSERPWEREGWCDDKGRCWCMSSLDGPPPSWWLVRPDPLSDGWVLPAHALPLPSGEVKP